MPGIIQQQMPDPQQAAAPDVATQPPDPSAQQPDASMQAPAADSSGQPPAGGSGDPMAQYTPQNVRAGMTLPPALRDAYTRVVTAGMKVMFDPKTHGQMQQLLQEPGPMDQKLGDGIAGLMLLLYSQSNKTIPPKVIIPAGVELLAHAVDYLKQSGTDVAPQDVAEGTSIMISTLLKKFGVDPDKLQAHIVNGGQQAQQPPQPPADDDESQEDPNEEAQESPSDEQAEQAQELQQPQGA